MSRFRKRAVLSYHTLERKRSLRWGRHPARLCTLLPRDGLCQQKVQACATVSATITQGEEIDKYLLGIHTMSVHIRERYLNCSLLRFSAFFGKHTSRNGLPLVSKSMRPSSTRLIRSQTTARSTNRHQDMTWTRVGRISYRLRQDTACVTYHELGKSSPRNEFS